MLGAPSNSAGFFLDHLPWWIAALIVVGGLFIYGFKDLKRFSFRRSWAISSVSFAESIRRRVLWITPLAILGVIVVSQLQHPVDEQDAIRQTTKFCLFASGLLVTITGVILACTNLPREIESRVIYTVVTKPTTRLEIVVGKVLGFARVSAAILIIMGVFSFAYLEIRAAMLRNFIAQRLETNDLGISRPTMEHYKQAGLLGARSYDAPDDFQIYSRLPAAGDDRRYMFGGSEGQYFVPFLIPQSAIIDATDPNVVKPLAIAVYTGYERSDFEQETSDQKTGPTTLPYYIQNPDATPEQLAIDPAASSGLAEGFPAVSLEILDPNFNSLVSSTQINGGKVLPLLDPEGVKPQVAPLAEQGMVQLVGARRDDSSPILVFVQVTGTSRNYEYFARQVPLELLTIDGQRILPMVDPRTTGAGATATANASANPIDPTAAPGGGKVIQPTFRTRTGTFGIQLRGGTKKVPMSLFRFRDAPISSSATADGNVRFELKVGIERANSDAQTEDEPTKVELEIVDRSPGASGVPSAPIYVYPETNRTTYVSVPASEIKGPNFDVIVRARSADQYIGVTPRSLLMVQAQESFGFNLFKSLFILWLLAILVVIISIFCSTFLSWPIAIVLTLLILLGHWGAQQLGDALAPGIGNMFVTDMFPGADASVARTVSSTVEGLTKLLKIVTSVLPDISQFSAMEDMERGIAIPMARLTDSLSVIALFGIPMIVLSYILLRNKEVAP